MTSDSAAASSSGRTGGRRMAVVPWKIHARVSMAPGEGASGATTRPSFTSTVARSAAARAWTISSASFERLRSIEDVEADRPGCQGGADPQHDQQQEARAEGPRRTHPAHRIA